MGQVADFELTPARTLAIAIVDAQRRPVEGAQIYNAGRDLLANTGSDGCVQIESGRDGIAVDIVRIVHPRHPEWRGTITGTPDAPQTIVLADGTRIRGTIAAATGERIAWASVWLSGRTRPVLSDESGAFEIGGAPGAVKLDVLACGFAPWEKELFPVPGRDEVVDVRLEPGRSVAVEVVDVAGAPLGGATVRWMEPDSPPPQWAIALSDAGGRAELRDLPSRPVMAFVAKEGYLRLRIDIEPDQASVRLQLDAAGCLCATVLDDASGQPIETVTAKWLGIGGTPSRLANEGKAVACDRGWFEVSADTLRAGAEYQVTLQSPGYRDATMPLRAVAKSELARPGATIRLAPEQKNAGAVFDAANGRPVAGAKLWRYDARGQRPAGRPIVTGVTGEFALSGASAGERVRIEHDEFVARDVVLEPGMRVLLARGAVVRGRAEPDVFVELAGGDEPGGLRRPAVRTSPEGEFRFAGLGPGRYQIRVLGRDARRPLALAARAFELRDGEGERIVDATAADGDGEIAGTVDGVGAACEVVCHRAVDGGDAAKWWQGDYRVAEVREGTFTFTGVAEGRHVLRLHDGGREVASATVAVRRGERVAVHLRR
jgi:hypothetical protein